MSEERYGLTVVGAIGEDAYGRLARYLRTLNESEQCPEGETPGIALDDDGELSFISVRKIQECDPECTAGS